MDSARGNPTGEEGGSCVRDGGRACVRACWGRDRGRTEERCASCRAESFVSLRRGPCTPGLTCQREHSSGKTKIFSLAGNGKQSAEAYGGRKACGREATAERRIDMTCLVIKYVKFHGNFAEICTTVWRKKHKSEKPK